MRLLTEFLTWLNELDLVEFRFSCCGCVSRVVWEETGFRVRSRCVSVFANERLCEVLENAFWDGWNLNFSVDYDRAKCQERVGENGIEIRLTVYARNGENGKTKKSCYVRWARTCVYFYHFLAQSCVCTARPCMLSGL